MPRARAGLAGLFDLLAATVAAGAGLLQGEEALRHPHLTLAIASAALIYFAARVRAGARAGAAADYGRQGELDLVAFRRLLQIDLEVVLHILATLAPPPTASAAEEIGKDIGEDIRNVNAFSAEAALTIDPSVTKAVVGFALLGVGEHFVSRVDFLELLLGFGVIGVLIGMVLHRHPPISLLNLVASGVFA